MYHDTSWLLVTPHYNNNNPWNITHQPPRSTVAQQFLVASRQFEFYHHSFSAATTSAPWCDNNNIQMAGQFWWGCNNNSKRLFTLPQTNDDMQPDVIYDEISIPIESMDDGWGTLRRHSINHPSIYSSSVTPPGPGLMHQLLSTQNLS